MLFYRCLTWERKRANVVFRYDTLRMENPYIETDKPKRDFTVYPEYGFSIIGTPKKKKTDVDPRLIH